MPVNTSANHRPFWKGHGVKGRSIDPRAIVAGCWACAGALLISIAIDDESRIAKGSVAVILGLVIVAVTWNRFPRWEGRPSSMRAVPLIAAIQLAIVVIVWWQLAS
jgi:hypothetical protein